MARTLSRFQRKRRDLSLAATRATLFYVAPTERLGWRVSIEGGVESHRFIDKRLAIQYAHSWAQVNRPSRVLLLNAPEGAVESAWSFAGRAGATNKAAEGL